MSSVFCAFNCGRVDVEPASAADRRQISPFAYAPRHKVGDIDVQVDDLRLLRGSWRGINLFHQWANCYSPLSWGLSRRIAGDASDALLPAELHEPLVVYLVPGLPIHVTATPESVEYTWSWAYRRADFSADDVESAALPRLQTRRHLDCDVQQVNHVVVNAVGISLTTTLRIDGQHNRDVTFFPVLFPGVGAERKYRPETRLAGATCDVISADGSTRSVIYPSEVIPHLWLTGEPRSLSFDLGRDDRIEYQFRFSDPRTSLSLYANTGWPTQTLGSYRCPSIVGQIVIPKAAQKSNSPYECTLQMEVTVGVRKRSPFRTVAPSALRRRIDIRVIAKAPLAGFVEDEPIEFALVLDGFSGTSHGALVANVCVLDYENQEVARQHVPIVPSRDTLVKFARLDGGAFVVTVALSNDGVLIAEKSDRFWVRPRAESPRVADGFFGCASGFMRFPGAAMTDVVEAATLLRDLGVGRVRWAAHWAVDWGKVEAERGRYQFPASFPELDKVRALGLEAFLSFGTFEGPGEFTPAWARSSRTTLYGYTVPQELGDYENYCCEVAKRFQGLVDAFEIENEPNYVRPKSETEMVEYIDIKTAILASAYRGIKRGQPDATVIGGTVGVTGLGDLFWLERVLGFAAARGRRLFDVMAPHYILRGKGSPEDYLDRLNRSRQIADAHGLRLWNGENGDELRPYDHIYPHSMFRDDERVYAAQSIRQYLWHRAAGVEHVNANMACEWVPPRGLHHFEYEGQMAATFYGRGGFLKPHAIAHATLARLLNGAVHVGRVELNRASAFAMAFVGRESAVVPVWTKSEKALLQLAAPVGTTVVNIVGRRTVLSGVQAILVGPEPLYLVADLAQRHDLLDAVRSSRWL